MENDNTERTASDHASARLSRRSMLTLTATGALAGWGLAGGGLAGCGFGAGSGPDDDPVEALPADQIVFGVSPGPGFTPPVYWALSSPSLIVYGSGRVLSISGTLGRVPAHYTEAHIDPLRVARFVRDAGARAVLRGNFGTPQVTDLGSVRVWLHGTTRHEVSVYAFSSTFDDLVSWSQRRRRRQLRALVDEGFGLAGDAAQPYVPDRIVVLEQQLLRSSEPVRVNWPGPDPDSFLHQPRSVGRSAIACGALTGQQARTVYAAALSNPDQRWRVSGTSRVLAVNSLPLEIDC
jgi:hypothetical protein